MGLKFTCLVYMFIEALVDSGVKVRPSQEDHLCHGCPDRAMGQRQDGGRQVYSPGHHAAGSMICSTVCIDMRIMKTQHHQ